jgi:hypothetical protein
MGGLDWQSSTVAGIERGIRRLGLGEVFAVALTLEVSVQELLPRHGRVRLAPDLDVAAHALAALWDGTTDELEASAVRSPAMGRMKVGVALARAELAVVEKHAKAVGVEISAKAGMQILRASRNEAEIQAAGKLGVDVLRLCVAAHALWGRSLTAEREARVPESDELTPRGVQARRAMITRSLTSELAGFLAGRG